MRSVGFQWERPCFVRETSAARRRRVCVKCVLRRNVSERMYIGDEMFNRLQILVRSGENVDKKDIFDKISRMLKGREAKRIAVFGSFARGEETPESDIDILVEFSEQKSLLDLVRIERELSELLGMKVDLLTEKSISPYLIDDIKREMEVII